MLAEVLEVSLSMTAVIAAALILAPLLEKKYSSAGFRILWLILSVRLLIPFNISLPHAPVTIAPAERVVVLRTDSSLPVSIMTNAERAEAAKKVEMNSANYAPLFSLEDLLSFLWLFGAALFMLFHLASYWVFALRIRKRLDPAGVSDGLPYYRCEGIDSPIMIGFFRPKVLLPKRDFSPEELDIILEHERTHLRRGDLWYKLVILAANAAHWFNPAVYLMARRSNKDVEYSCDEAVVKGKSFDFRRKYSMTILRSMRRSAKYEKE